MRPIHPTRVGFRSRVSTDGTLAKMEQMVSRRRIPLNDFGIAALKMFVRHDLFDRLRDRSRVPDETKIAWYQELHYQVVAAARRVRDPYTGGSPPSPHTCSDTRSRRLSHL
jgi:hypothetical protein